MTLLRTLITRTGLLIGVATLAMAWAGAPSTARATESAWLTVPAGMPLFTLTGIAPGDTGSATIVVTNPQPFPVRFSIAVTGLANDDNGCNEPEQAIGDTTCGAGGGELQSNLRMVLTATGQTDRPVAEDIVAEWAARPAIDTIALSGYESRSYRIGYELPIEASNVTQSDLVAFQLEMHLEQELDSFVSDPPPAVIAATPSLPGTGTDAGAIVILALGVILVGVGVYTMSTSRRRSR